MSLDQMLRHCVSQHERKEFLWEFHAGVVRDHVGGNATARKILHTRLWHNYGGPISIEILQHFPRSAMSVKVSVSLRDMMSYHYTQSIQ